MIDILLQYMPSGRQWTFILIVALVIRWLNHVVQDDDNDLEWWELISSRGDDGKQHIDINQIGLLQAMILSPFAVGYAIYSGKPVDTNTVWLFGIWLVFSAGVKMFATWFRSFIDRRFGKNDTEIAKGT